MLPKSQLRRGSFVGILLWVILSLSVTAFSEPYPVIPLRQKYVGEEKGEAWMKGSGKKIHYADEAELAQYKVTIKKDGLLYDSNDKLVNILGKKQMYVMDAAGNIFISPEDRPGLFHHSSFFAGKPVAAAGDIIIRKGKILYIDNDSGHYAPTTAEFNNVLMQLARQGILLKQKRIRDITIDPLPPPSLLWEFCEAALWRINYALGWVKLPKY